MDSDSSADEVFVDAHSSLDHSISSTVTTNQSSTNEQTGSPVRYSNTIDSNSRTTNKAARLQTVSDKSSPPMTKVASDTQSTAPQGYPDTNLDNTTSNIPWITPDQVQENSSMNTSTDTKQSAGRQERQRTSETQANTISTASGVDEPDMSLAASSSAQVDSSAEAAHVQPECAQIETNGKAGKSTTIATDTTENFTDSGYFHTLGSNGHSDGTQAKTGKMAYAGQIAGTIASHGYSTLSLASSAAGRLYSYATSPSPTQPVSTGLNEEQDLQLQKILDGWDAVEGERVHEEIKDRLVVAVMGRVSAGKSTLMKALLQIDPAETDVLQVSALSGTTKDAQAFLWQLKGCEFVILDFPGFQEVFDGRADAAEHFDETIKGFFKYGVIDVGIYVANGVPDGSQKTDFERLAKYSSEVFLVRSKADDLETFSEKGKEKVIHQWLNQFNVDKLYLTKIVGYDPDSRIFPNARVEGVDELRNDIYESVKNKKKGALLDLLKNGIMNVGLEQASTYVTVGLAVLMAVMRAR